MRKGAVGTAIPTAAAHLSQSEAYSRCPRGCWRPTGAGIWRCGGAPCGRAAADSAVGGPLPGAVDLPPICQIQWHFAASTASTSKCASSPALRRQACRFQRLPTPRRTTARPRPPNCFLTDSQPFPGRVARPARAPGRLSRAASAKDGDRAGGRSALRFAAWRRPLQLVDSGSFPSIRRSPSRRGSP